MGGIGWAMLSPGGGTKRRSEMAKKRAGARAAKRARKEEWKRMTPEARRVWSEARERTAKTGYAKRKRERANGVGMSNRSGEWKPWWSPGLEMELLALGGA